MISIYSERITVSPSEIDVLGHVNNQVYLKWMERVATNHAAANGWPYSRLVEHSYMWVAKRHWLEYIKSAFEGEEITLHTWVQGLRGAGCLRRYAFVRDSEEIFIGATEWAFLDAARMRPMIVPDVVKNSFEIISPDDPRLAELGIGRRIRFAPSAAFMEQK